MTQIAETDNLESEQDQETLKPLTIEEARANREKAKAGEATEPEAPEAEDESEEVVEETAEDSPEVEEVEDEEESPDNVLSKLEDEFDLDDLSEEQMEALTEKLEIGSRKAFAKQRLEIKELKAQVDAERLEKEEALKLRQLTPSVEELDTSIQQAETNAEYWNDQLILNQDTEYDEASGKDIKGVRDESGKFYPAQEVLNFVKAERKKVTDLRQKRSEAEKESASAGDVEAKIDTFKAELGIEGEAEERYDALIKSPKFKLVKSLIPEYGVELAELLAQASLYDGKSKKKKVILKRKAPKSTPNAVPSSPNGRGNAKSGRASELSKIVSGGGYTPQEKLNAMRELRTLNNR